MSAQTNSLRGVSTLLENKWVRRAIDAVVVLAIIALIVPWGGTGISDLKKAQLKTAQLDESALLHGVDLFLAKTGHLPANLNELVPQFVQEVHQDPWGGAYQLEIRGDQYAVVSLGKSQRPGATEIVASHPLPQLHSQDQKTERHSP